MTVTLIWMAVAYRAAPVVPLWQPAPIFAWVPRLVIPLACILLVAGLTIPNPTLVGGERFFDGAPGSPAVGILSVTRHPFLVAGLRARGVDLHVETALEAFDRQLQMDLALAAQQH